MKTIDNIYIPVRTHATFLNLHSVSNQTQKASVGKTKTIIWPGRSELSSGEKHRRKLWGQKRATRR